MALKLIANYSKRLGLPGYSSHQFSVSVETELSAAGDIAAESERLYQLLQSNVDEQILHTGFVPPGDYGMDPPEEDLRAETSSAPATNVSQWQGGPSWKCSEKQSELILNLVNVHQLDKASVEALAVECFGKGVRVLTKIEASGLIDELLDTHGGANAREMAIAATVPLMAGPMEGGRHDCRSRTIRHRADTLETLPWHISPSAAKSYLGCSLKFYFERVACIRRKEGKAACGGGPTHGRDTRSVGSVDRSDGSGRRRFHAS
jgi:hypothetical protein